MVPKATRRSGPRLEPRPGTPPRPVRCEHQRDEPMLDVPPCCQPAIADATVPLLFTEGARKADCPAGFNGWCILNAFGALQDWSRRDCSQPAFGQDGESRAGTRSTAGSRCCPRSTCYLAFDSDARSNPGVKLALPRLANVLSLRGALVHVILATARRPSCSWSTMPSLGAGAPTGWCATCLTACPSLARRAFA
jgi:hypothetical protein